jgi:uracil-DNA glycosylase
MNPKDKIHKDWLPIINLLYQEPLKTLSETILPNISYQPKSENIFKVFEVPINTIKVVILGQDPYPTPRDAIGLSFVNGTNKIPVSLRNIYKEIIDSTDNDIVTPSMWQKQGIFLLNTALTVETGKAGSHLKYWEDFTKKVINHLSISQPCIWLLWGKKAEKFIPYIKNTFNASNYTKEDIEQIPINPDWNYLLVAPHPAAEAYSGGTAGFFGCNHFYNTNRVLNKLNKSTINW